MNFEEQVPRAAINTQQQDKSSNQANILDNTRDALRKPRKGYIVGASQFIAENGEERIYVRVRIDDNLSEIRQGSFNRMFILDLSSSALALLYGTLEDLIGLRVLLNTSGGRKDQGIATIINESGRGNLEKASTLKAFGTLLAPAGNGI